MVPIGAVVPDGLVQVNMAVARVLEPIWILASVAVAVGALVLVVAVSRDARARRADVRARSVRVSPDERVRGAA